MTATFRMIQTSDIRPNKRNVREDLGDLTELAGSLRANGIQQPIIVTDQVTHYELVDGARRHGAAVLAAIKVMPAIVTEISGTRPTLVTMLAAAMHKQLTPLEQAKAFLNLKRDGMTIQSIAQATGYTRNTIQNRLLLLELPAEVLDMVTDGDLTLAEAQGMARQVRSTGTATGTRTAPRSTWLTKSHRLAQHVTRACNHDPATVTLVGGVGCGACWEDIIRADERQTLKGDPHAEPSQATA